ncbi:MAG: fructosamine kinase family protein [Deinococcota bacterium]|nr:fructosamine kinase family protein [Deinococcota bacterium]
MPGLEGRIGMALGEAVQGLEPLRGGCIAEVYRARLADGTAVVVKYDPGPEASLGLEAAMLRFLAKRSSLPVPQVFYAEDDLLVLEYVENDGKVSATTETHAAELLAELHSLSAPRFGFEQDTVIGPLVQPNPWTGSWLAFYREQRLGAMAQEAYRAGTLDETLLGRLERLVDDLDTFIGEPEAPSLVHGDVWSGNVLVRRGRIAAFIDPALYYADAEVELAFIALFHTFGRRFFEVYSQHRPSREGFLERRKEVYSLYPLLVHARLFGAPYDARVAGTLARIGY